MDRLLIYSHDTYGLGHLRRSLRIAHAAISGGVATGVLVVSGSPEASSFELATGVDVVKLPAVTKLADGSYGSRTLGMSLEDVTRVRGQLAVSAVASFRPDVVLVDHAPLGMGGELLPLLESIDSMRPRPSLVYGMRDIVDQSQAVAEDWTSQGAWEWLSTVYDGVIVYGDAVVRTTAAELDLARRLPVGVEHVGYVAPLSLDRVRSWSRRPTIVVTVGGGGDGLPVLEAYAGFLERSPMAGAVRSVLVTGPLAATDPQVALFERVSGLPVDIVRFSNRMESLLATADGAITMAGYNTVAELLSYRLPAILVPRTRPRVEQWLRATRLGAVADFCPVGADEITLEHIERFVIQVLDRPHGHDHQLDLGGAHGAALALARLSGRTVAEAV